MTADDELDLRDAVRTRFGLPDLGAALEVELLTSSTTTATTVVGLLAAVVLTAPQHGLPPAALVIAHPGGTRSVIPWHAIARVVVRPSHPAL